MYGVVLGTRPDMPGIIAIRGDIGGIRQSARVPVVRCDIMWPDIAASDGVLWIAPGATGVVRSRWASNRALGDVPRSTSRPLRERTLGDRSALISTRNWM